MAKLLNNIWSGWKRVARKIGRVQTIILLSLAYFLIIAPVGGLFRLFGWDPLESGRRHRDKPSNWKPAKSGEPDSRSLERLS